MLNNDNDKMPLPMSSEDLSWLINQLEQWPTRVEPSKTTNIQFLMKNASEVIKALMWGDLKLVISNFNDPITDHRQQLRGLNTFYSQLVNKSKAEIKAGRNEEEVWEYVYSTTQNSNLGGRVKELVEQDGGMFDYYDPSTSRKDDAMAFIQALRSYVGNM